jgi:DNA-binding NarL/FixJ family response regulator
MSPQQPAPRSVVIADDHALLRAGLRALIARDKTLRLVGEASTAQEVLHAVALLDPRLLVMDLAIPGAGGMEAIRYLKLHHPGVMVLVMTLQAGEEAVHSALKAGVNGYILKDASRDEFLIAIQTVLQGKTYLSADISAQGAAGHGPTTGETSYDSLTRREREVLKLVAEGHSNKWIAELLSLSAKTVEKHRGNLMRKLGLHNASMLTAYALAKGLVLSYVKDS